MRYTTFNKQNYNVLDEPLFLGRSINVARYDQQKHPFFEENIQKQIGQFWMPDEFPLDKDCVDFSSKLNERERQIFIRNLLYQTLLDSVQGRSPNMAFLPLASQPELETWIETWSFFETIHSRSYTYILRNLPIPASDIFDSLVEDKQIIARAESVTRYYDELIEYSNWHNVLGPGTHTVNGDTLVIDERELHKRLYRALIAVYALEGIRFYVSFACSFSFAESGLMEGVAKVIQAISQDEALHCNVVRQTIETLQNGNDEGAEHFREIAKEEQDNVIAIIDEVVHQEKEWADYLFEGETIRNLNAQTLKQYVEYLGNDALRKIGFTQRYAQKTNPLSFMRTWLQANAMKVAPQETQRADYMVGRFDMRMTDAAVEEMRAVFYDKKRPNVRMHTSTHRPATGTHAND